MRRLLCLTLVCASFTMGLAAHAVERVISFDTIERIQRDGSVVVTEEIRYDFGSESRHGIYRDIPVRYRSDIGSYTIRLKNIAVDDESGRPYLFDVSNE